MTDIYILGAGAMGCLWATYFNDPTRYRVTFIVRSPSQWATVPHHIHCTPHNSITPVRITHVDDVQEIQHLVVATKAPESLAGVRALSARLAPNAQIMLLQNGMGSQQAIAQAFAQHAIYACSSTEGVYKTQLNQLVHAGQGENHIGGLTTLAKQPTLQQWLPARLFEWHEDIDTVLWRKLVINAAINPLTVLYQCRNGALLDHPQAHLHMKQLCAELDSLLHAKGLPITHTLALAEQVCQRTAQNYSSMYKDAEAGRPTEIDFINGFVVSQATQLGLTCPTHEQVINHIKMQTSARLS